ncbi:MAG: hypothetical protein F2894_03460 [Actinobacteria bacterium]|uniref:Unannotated protein n=1 Tax=freshwater metagenome TaxID=449393 RepID=A0A6J6M9K2_9ZZZZ|nr:hypothetical protein [Actinomycetota bacterium]MSZ30160.1 hypothetical protein [Actinomycetota bacterium]
MKLDLASVLMEWGIGILALLWVTTRGRLVSLGYGWLLRSLGAAMLGGAIWASIATGGDGTARIIALTASALAMLSALFALASSITHRSVGVRVARERKVAKAERVDAMLGESRKSARASGAESEAGAGPTEAREFNPILDLIAPAFGLIALVAESVTLGGPAIQSAYRLVIGAAFLGVLTDAMLLGHWYLTQPGLPRAPIEELVKLSAPIWALEVIGLLWPIGMISVLSGSVDDGYGGILAWMWALSAASTGALIGVTWLALRERSYSAVMAATGLLYLAILTGFGTDVLARALLGS